MCVLVCALARAYFCVFAYLCMCVYVCICVRACIPICICIWWNYWPHLSKGSCASETRNKRAARRVENSCPYRPRRPGRVYHKARREKQELSFCLDTGRISAIWKAPARNVSTDLESWMQTQQRYFPSTLRMFPLFGPTEDTSITLVIYQAMQCYFRCLRSRGCLENVSDVQVQIRRLLEIVKRLLARRTPSRRLPGTVIDTCWSISFLDLSSNEIINYIVDWSEEVFDL